MRDPEFLVLHGLAMAQSPTLYDAKCAGEAKGWTFVRAYADNAVSGFSTYGRSAFTRIQSDAKEGQFDCIVVENVDRLSRNLGDLAKFRELMEFHDVVIYSLSKGGFISDLDVGFKGTMSAQFLKDLSQKTKRGLAAKFRKGLAAGGISYGYERTSEPGVHKINEVEAEIVRRIFVMYASGLSPRQIAGQLNKEQIPGPRGGAWNASTINGHRQRNNGILRNSVYVGERCWGKTEKVRNPETGRKVIRVRTGDKLHHNDPELRILDQDLWDRVQTRLPNRENSHRKKRTDYLLSGLMKCGACGSSYISQGGGQYVKFGCSARRERSTCSNRRMISRSLIDNSVLYAISNHLLKPECIDPAIREYNKDLSKFLASLETTRPRLEKRLSQIGEARRKLLLLLEKGIEPEAIETRLLELDDEERSKKSQLASAPQPAEVDPTEAQASYKKAVGELLANALEDNYAYKIEVMTAVRELVDKVVIYPSDDPDGRDVELIGDIEALCVPKAGRTDSFGGETMVPGGGIEPPTRGFSIHCSTPELPGHGNGICHWVEAFYDLPQAVSRGFLTFFQCGRCGWLSAGSEPASASSSRCDGTAYEPFSHFAKSISAQRFEQNGRKAWRESSPQIGQLISVSPSMGYDHVCAEVRNDPAGSNRPELSRPDRT